MPSVGLYSEGAKAYSAFFPGRFRLREQGKNGVLAEIRQGFSRKRKHNKTGAPCRWRARLPGLPEKGMEGKVYEEDSNSAAF